MHRYIKTTKLILLILAIIVLGGFSSGHGVADTFPPEQAAGSIGLEGTISTAPPSQGATIVTPVNGTSFSTLPITVDGLCPSGLLVKLFSNNVFVGSEQCNNGSYSIQIDLFEGQNQLVANVYDALDQAGPASNTVTVSFNNAQVVQLETQLVLTSDYAKRGADPGAVLDWPIIMSGGTGPFAISVDWGDGSPAELLSESFDGTFTIDHIYKSAGVYNVTVKATDSDGNEAFLQLVGVADGAIQSGTTTSGSGKSSSGGTSGGTSGSAQTQILWWPAIAMVPLIGITFWIGRRHELFSLRRQLEKNRRENP